MSDAGNISSTNPRKPLETKARAILNAAGAINRMSKQVEEAKARKAAAAQQHTANAWFEEWNKWITRIELPNVVMSALCMPRDGEQEAFEYMSSLTRGDVARLLGKAQLGGLTDVIMQGLEQLEGQAASSASALNAKFQQTGKFMMGYGGLDIFFGGLENLLGPPQMVKDPDGLTTIVMGMEAEHTQSKDCDDEFTSSNGATTTSRIEWDFAHNADPTKAYPERVGFAENHPEWCRQCKSMDALMELLETKANSKLRKEGSTELVWEELLGGRLYTGHMCICAGGLEPRTTILNLLSLVCEYCDHAQVQVQAQVQSL